MANRLFRSKDDKVIAGVCGGLGEYFSVDPIIFRILFVVGVLADGIGLIIYIVMALFVPEGEVGTEKIKKEETKTEKEIEVKPKGPNLTGGIILIGLGLIFLLDNLLPNLEWEQWWPLLLVAVGAGLLIQSFKE